MIHLWPLQSNRRPKAPAKAPKETGTACSALLSLAVVDGVACAMAFVLVTTFSNVLVPRAATEPGSTVVMVIGATAAIVLDED